MRKVVVVYGFIGVQHQQLPQQEVGHVSIVMGWNMSCLMPTT